MCYKPKAIIFGVTGQDGSYLSELLLSKEYEVYGIVRRSSVNTKERITHLLDNPHFHIREGDVTDPSSVCDIIGNLKADECYNLAAMSHVGTSFKQPTAVFHIDALGPLNCLEAIRTLSPETRYYQASTSEMFGSNLGEVVDCSDENNIIFQQSEETALTPNSPYAVAKTAAHHLVRAYREAYGLFACAGILLNHESERRGEEFVTRKITKWIGEFCNWTNSLSVDRIIPEDDGYIYTTNGEKFPKLKLGNLTAYRDWGHAQDYCINLNIPILTTGGWKFYDDINIDDTIINFNPNKNRLDTDTVKRKLLLNSDGEKVLLKGRGVYLNVCPNHRIYYQRKSVKSKGGWSDWKVCSAIEFYHLLKDKKIRTRYDYRLPHFQGYEHNKEVENVGLDHNPNMVYLIGCLLTEGCLTRTEKGNGYRVSISQSKIANENIYNKINNIIRSLELTFKMRNRNDGVCEWVFTSESSARILSWFDNYNIHVMPSWCYSLSCRNANVLIDAMMDCDGYWDGMVYTSKRYKLIVDFQSIAALAGYRTTQVKQNNGDCYTVCLITTSKKHQYITDVSLHNDKAEKVWCIETNNGTIISRDNDCISISGNCKAMWMMMQSDEPVDYLVATGCTYSVADFCRLAFKEINIDNWNDYIVVDPELFRPCEVPYLCGNSSKIQDELGWQPTVTFEELVKRMVESDIKNASKKA